MKKLDDLITEARRQTDNSDNTNTEASDSVSTEEFIYAANDAQDRLQSLITARYPEEFVTQKIIDIVSGTEAYSISDRVYLNARIHSVEWSYTGNIKDYYVIQSGKIRERDTQSGSPCFYIRRNGQLLLNPIPNTSVSKLRVNYERELDDVDVRRAKVTGTTGTPLTSIAIDSAQTGITSLGAGDYICISDKYGVVKAYNIPVTSATISAITIPSHTLGTDESITAGDYVTIGKYTTTHSKLSDACERHLVAYMVWRILMRDDKKRARDKEQEYLSIESDIIAGYSDITRDVEFIPILDSELL
jgi:hypothetical protein